MSHIKQKCEEYFDTKDFYEVLKVPRTATEKEIKKAYHKLSLLVHPDRVEEHQKKIATEKFKVLGAVHSILQDKEKRKIYDDTGDVDEEDSSFNWVDYWRKLFREINDEDIENYKKEYIGSDLELKDIKRAYVGSKGDMNHLLEYVAFSDCANEPRYIAIVRKLVENGEVEEYDSFFHENTRKKKRRHLREKKERELVESLDVEQIRLERESMRQQRALNFSDMIADIEAKYTKGKKRKSITAGEEKPKIRRTRAKK